MRQRYYKQKRIKKLFVVHQRGNAYEKEIFENMYQCFGSNGSLAKRMRRSAAETVSYTHLTVPTTPYV